MSCVSLFTECKKCGKSISKSVRVCPKCGIKQKKLSVIQWSSLIFLVFIVASAINVPKNSSVDSAPKTQQKFEVSEKEVVREKLKLDFSWRKEGFSSIMTASFTIENNSEYDIKDVEIICVHYAKSGTRVDKNKRTIFEIIEAKSSKSYFNFNMGFVHSQANSSSCLIKEFTVII